LEVGTKNQKFLANVKSGAYSNSCIDSLFSGVTPTLHKSAGSLSWCCAMMSLQFTQQSAVATRLSFKNRNSSRYSQCNQLNRLNQTASLFFIISDTLKRLS